MAIQTYIVPSDRIVHETRVDFNQRCIQKVIHVVQYDKSLPVIAVKLFLNGATYTLPANADVKIRWGKKDHTFVYKNVLGCDESRQVVYFDVDEQMTYFNGPCNPILEVIISGNKAGSSSMPFEIDRNPIQETDIESSSEYIELDRAVTEAKEAAKEAAEAIETVVEAETIVTEARDQAVTSANAAKVSEDNAKASETNSNTYKDMAETSANQSEIYKSQAEAEKNEAVAAKEAAEAALAAFQTTTTYGAVRDQNGNVIDKTYAAIGASYSKEDSDNKYADKVDVENIKTDYMKTADADLKYAGIGSSYTTQESDNKFYTIASATIEHENIQKQIDALVAKKDVVDIVNTKDDLDNYDTSKLGDNDIIQVLQDATHDKATSYYRWNLTTWNYIGSIAPYFNKEESEAKFSTKEELDAATEVLEAEIDEIKLFKFPNATIVGEPLINNGNISRFSSEDFLIMPFVVDVRDKAFEIQFSYTTLSDVNTQQNIIDSRFGLAVAIQNGHLVVAASSNGTDWDIGLGTGTHVLEANKNYNFKLTWDKTTYRAFISQEDGNWVEDITTPSAKGLFPTTIYIGGSPDLYGAGSTHPALGIINLNKSFLKIANIIVWQGMDDAGLSTRATVSLDNLDASGEKKFNDIKNRIPTELSHLSDGSRVSTLEENVDNIKTDIDDIERKIGKMHEKDIDFDEVIDAVRKGKGNDYYKTGDQFLIPYIWSGTTYSDCPHNVVDHADNVILNDNGEEETVPALTLEWDYTIPLGLAYDPDEALAEISSEGLPAGKYCICIDGDSWGSKNGLYYSFTLTEPLTEGMQLKPSGSYNSTSDTVFTMRVFSDGKSSTALQNVTMTLESSKPTDAIYLGKYGGTDYDPTIKNCFKPPYEKSGVDRILNHYNCVYLGCNVWLWSLYRQWLNGGADWVWTSQHPCDRAPSNYATLKGFLSGYSDDFVSRLKPRKCITYRNTVMFESRYDVTYDKVFLHSMANINVDGFNGDQNTGKLEGNPWEFYVNLAEGQTNLNANGTFKAWGTYEILKKYALNAKTSAQYVFSRSAYRSSGGGVLSVNASGYVYYHYAYYGDRCLPACILC